ncbi:uncharacterized protein LOC112456803, partial [Temnothorax curvispinosus]|uniref:Uncharacterized protein LOC112456803 n=1 Tax=Temnothorax curvispinosus TaxID=300111 RepID=A0A6J1Q307_9HYME
DEGNKSNITSNSKSSDSFYIPNSDASEESNIEDKRTSETSTKNGNKDLSKTSNNTTLETSIPLGHSAPDDTNMFVQSVGRRCKKDFCVYCRTEQTKLSYHLIRIHKDEKEVKEIIYLPKGQSKRRILINEIRKKGQYLFNTNSDINTGELKVMRRPNSEKNKNATDFSICPQCKSNYSKSALRHHYRRCTKKNSTDHKAILSKSRRISCRIHESASKILRDRVFPTMKDDSVSKVIRYDELAIDYGNKLCEKYHDPHFYDMIRQKLRQIGCLFLEIKNQNDKIDDLFTIFVPDNYDNCLKAVRNLAGLNESGTGFKTPSLATSLGTLLKQLCKRCITIMIKRRDKIRRKLAEEFLSLLTEDYAFSIARTAVETQLRKKRHSTVLLPTKDDIKKLETYLSDRMKTAYDSLKEKFSVIAWEALAEGCLLSIQLFNRRRPGEIERALIEDFQNYQEVNKNTIGAAYVSLSNDEKKAAEKYVRFTMRGKLGRTVPVLLHKQMLDNLKLLLSYRKTANVHSNNPYLFGVPGTLKGDYRYLRACDLMRRYSEECGAPNPDRLRGTNLRKHIATMCTNLNLRDHEISDLANFMGHADKIHKEHYRQPILSREIFHVSKLLEVVHGKDSDEEIDVEESDLPNVSSHSLDCEESNVSEYSTDKNKSLSSPSQVNHKDKKKRSTSPFGKCVRRRWTEEEQNITRATFKHHITSGIQPSFKEIQKMKDENPHVFANRSCATIKAWINNQMKKKKK